MNYCTGDHLGGSVRDPSLKPQARALSCHLAHFGLQTFAWATVVALPLTLPFGNPQAIRVQLALPFGWTFAGHLVLESELEFGIGIWF